MRPGLDLGHVLSVWVLIAGCESSESPPPEVSLTPKTVQAIVERTGREFERADFFKPRREDTDPFLFGLAPLILEELGGPARETPEAKPFGRLRTGDDGALEIDRSKPTVYYQRSNTTLSGRDYETLSFVWFYAVPSREKAAGEGPVAQGVRLTLDSRGFPMVQEVLRDRSGAAILYVSEAIETAARAEHGEALPGQSFAVESRAGPGAGWVVARTLRDGPQPMGPFVYLESDSRDVVTLLCRCMPSQVTEILGNLEYEFKPQSELEDLGIEPPGWPGSRPSGRTLEAWLRLPSEF